MKPGDRVRVTNDAGWLTAGQEGVVTNLPKEHGWDHWILFDDDPTQRPTGVMAYEVQTVPKPVTDEQVIA